MPIYAYRCDACGHAKDVLQKMSDPALTVCPACGASSFRKQLTAAGFQLKGSGWYATDFKGGAGAREACRRAGREAGGRRCPPRAAATPSLRARPRRQRPPARRAAARRVAAVRRAPAIEPPTEGSPLKKYLIAGLLVWLPLAITIWVLHAVLGLLDGVFGWLLSASQAVLPAGGRRADRGAAPGARAGRDRDGARPAAHRRVRRQHGRPVVAASGRDGCSTASRSSSRSTARSSRCRTRCSRAAATPSARRCWCSTRAPGAWTIAFVTGRPGGEAAHAPAGRLPQRLRADHAEPDVGLLPDGAAQPT